MNTPRKKSTDPLVSKHKRIERLCKKHYLAFIDATKNVQKSQQTSLLEIIKNNKKTKLGKVLHLDKIKNPLEFSKIVPISNYSFFEPFFVDEFNGKKNTAISGKILCFQPTSGSTGKNKIIVYSDKLHKEFSGALSAWIYNLYKNRPNIAQGYWFWSISPNGYIKSSKNKIGFQSDEEYFDNKISRLISSVLATPKSALKIKSFSKFQKAVVASIRSKKKISFVSIWSPSYAQQIFVDKKCFNDDPILVSCWTHGESAKYTHYLKEIFPKSEIQPKGLLATEYFASIPLFEARDPVLIPNGHYLEFAPLKNGLIDFSNCMTMDRLKIHQEYVLVATTSGGLYRYNTNDIIRVSGFFNQAPCIIFVGRYGNISDICGEKISEMQISNVFSYCQKKTKIIISFFMLAPEKIEDKINYVAYLKSNETEEKISAFIALFEKKLRENIHYKIARENNQLAELKAFLISGNPIEEYNARCLINNQKAGDIKIKILDKQTNWSQFFSGSFLKKSDNKL